MRWFRPILRGIEVGALLRQISENPHLWRRDTEWTAPKHGSAIYDLDNIVLRFNKATPDWNKPAFKILSAAQPIIFDLMRAIPGELLGKVIITRLRAGRHIAEHVDQMPVGVPIIFQRYQIPLAVPPGAIFHCGGESLYLEPGNAYWFDNQQPHSVVNNSDQDRISMLADIRPFDVDQITD
jgi:hypothetical protein